MLNLLTIWRIFSPGGDDGNFLTPFLQLANWRKLAINHAEFWQSKKIIEKFLRDVLLTSFLKMITALWSKEKTSANFSRFHNFEHCQFLFCQIFHYIVLLDFLRNVSRGKNLDIISIMARVFTKFSWIYKKSLMDFLRFSRKLAARLYCSAVSYFKINTGGALSLIFALQTWRTSDIFCLRSFGCLSIWSAIFSVLILIQTNERSPD